MRCSASDAEHRLDLAARAPAYSARSDASCAILVPDGVTRWSNSRAAIPAAPGERRDRPLEVIGHDLSRTAELLERRGPQRRRPRRTLDLPHALHDELEVRRLDPRPPPFPSATPRPPGAELDPARRRPRPARARRARPRRRPARPPSSLQRSSGRTIAARPAAGRACRGAGRCRTGSGCRALKPVEPRERVLAQREQDVDAQRPVDERGELPLRSRPPRRDTVKYSSAWSRIR